MNRNTSPSWVLAALVFCLPPLAKAAQKPPLIGLISMGRTGFGPANSNARFLGIPGPSLDDIEAKRNAFDGIVINVPWAQLQPAGPDSIDRSVIESTLSRIRAYNRDPRTTVKLRAVLRIWAGLVAPDWAKSLGGPPVTVFSNTRTPGNQAITLGRVWAEPYRHAWRHMLDQLGDIYDSEPLIAQISNTSCTTNDDEPNAITRDFDAASGRSSIGNLHGAGLNDAAFIDCLRQSPLDYTHWPTTAVNATFGAVFRTDGVPDYQHLPRDSGTAMSLIRLWRSDLGGRVVIANHNLNYPLNPRQIDIYRAIAAAGPPISFQTHSPKGLDWPNTVKEAVCLGAQSLELWNSTGAGGYMDQPVDTLIGWSRELKNPAEAGSCAGFEQ